jgi:hypothetical protein
MGYPPQPSNLINLHDHYPAHQHQHDILHPQHLNHHHLQHLEPVPHHMQIPAGDLHLQHHANGEVQQQAAAAPGGPPSSKVCSKCRVTKDAVDFFKDKSKPDGLYSQVRCWP